MLVEKCQSVVLYTLLRCTAGLFHFNTLSIRNVAVIGSSSLRSQWRQMPVCQIYYKNRWCDDNEIIVTLERLAALLFNVQKLDTVVYLV